MKNLKLLLSFTVILLLFSCASHVDPATIPDMGSGNRTWDQAVYLATHKTMYWVLGILSLVASFILCKIAWNAYDAVKVGSRSEQTFIRPAAVVVSLILIFAAWVHPIYNQLYY